MTHAEPEEPKRAWAPLYAVVIGELAITILLLLWLTRHFA